MKFFLDENIPFSSAKMLKDLGHEVEHVRTVGLRGSSDTKVAEYAREHDSILISRDLDFGNILLYPQGSHHGVLVIRLPHDFTGKQITEKLREFIETIDVDDLEGRITVLELGRYRTRDI